MTLPRQLVLGTAGHIDHGKSTLIRRLTNIDPDRLPEEKKRGITIDLGFAHLDLDDVRYGIVDVPGHERFVHNMVTGATGVDVALLVVAADDSVMPQTREHVAILDLLGLTTGLVVVTKCDLVDEQHLELVREELAETLEGTFLAKAPVVTVSSTTGAGIDRLRSLLKKLGMQHQSERRRPVFRMPIDRVFTIQGHGTVVTGTVLSGEAALGEHLWLMPSQTKARVRQLQSHNAQQDSIRAGQRAAVNLAGIKADQVQRGDELTVEGYLHPARRLLAQLQVLSSFPRALKNRQLVRLHLGTREVTARLVLKGSPVEPGELRYVELRTLQPVLADFGQRFIIRNLSPATTIGGGTIISPNVPVRFRPMDLQEVGRKLADSDPAKRLASYLEDHDLEAAKPLQLACVLGIGPDEQSTLLDQLFEQGKLTRLQTGVLIHRERKKQLIQRIFTVCRRELKRRQPTRTVPRPAVVSAMGRWTQTAIAEVLTEELVRNGKLQAMGDNLAIPGSVVKLTKRQRHQLDVLIGRCRDNNLTPPLLKEVGEDCDVPLKELKTLADVGVQEGVLEHVSDDLCLGVEQAAELIRMTKSLISESGPATVAQLRDHWGVTRKYAVPYCEFLDRIGVTVRDGDVRGLGKNGLDATETSA